MTWLYERNNDPYGTPNSHPFWHEVQYDDIGSWRVFERDKEGFAYDRQHNAWYGKFPNKHAAANFAEEHSKAPDPWS